MPMFIQRVRTAFPRQFVARHLLAAPMLLGAWAVMLTGCHEQPVSAVEESLPAVKISRPVEKDIVEYAYYTGRLDAEQAVNVQARVTGYLTSIDFDSGAEVKAGQQLFLIDPRPYQAQLDVATSQIALAEAQLELANADLARAKDVAKTPGAISRQELDKYAASQREAEAQLQAAKANAESARLNVEFTRVLSPIDGRVSRNLLSIGNLVKQDTTLLTTVVSLDPIYAYFDVDEHTVLKVRRMIREGKLQVGKEDDLFPVELGLADEGNEYPHQGMVDFINNAIDPSTGTLQLRGQFANPKGEHGIRMFSPGMFVRIRLPLSEPFKAMLVPQAAIGTDQGLKYVLIVNDQDVVEYRPIQLGPEQPGGMQAVFPIPMVQTETGLRPVEVSPDGMPNVPQGTETVPSIEANSRIVVSGLQRAKPGRKVHVTEVAIEADTATKPQTPGAKDDSKPKQEQQAQAGDAARQPADKTTPADSAQDGKQGEAASRTETPK